MTSDRENCGLSSLLPVSCQGRAEAFARSLHSRLTSLGSNGNNGTTDESSWLNASHEKSLTLSQPRQTDSDLFFDFDDLGSPGSPEEPDAADLGKIINDDKFKLLYNNTDCKCPTTNEKNTKSLRTNGKNSSYDSDSSDGTFFDTDENEINPIDCCLSKTNQDEEINIKHINGFTSITPQDDLSLNCKVSTISSQVFDLSIADDAKCNEFESNPKCKLDDPPQSCSEETDKSEKYSSCLIVEKNLTIECPNPEVVITLDKPISNELHFHNSISHTDDDNDDEADVIIPRVRRCSSLKTGKTPPGTPGRKKIVRFADVLGLDLADVRTFLDEIPKIPNSAYTDLRDVDLNDSAAEANLNSFLKNHCVKLDKLLVPLFQQPGGQPDFMDKIRDKQVCLDNALVEDPVTLTISGTVRVKNLDFHKSVHIRYTLDSWQTYADVQATYVENSCDGFSDKFSFILFAHTLPIGQKIQFAIRFQCKGRQYWDNNNGINYCFQCLPAANNTTTTPPPPMLDDNWSASFY